MIRVDEQFLKEVGLDTMPEPRRSAFIKYAQEELEVRVGERLSQGLSEAQLDEFDGIMRVDRDAMIRTLARLGGDYRLDPLYQKVLQKHGVANGTLEILAEYLSVKWIRENRPDYARMIETVATEFKAELRDNAQRILQS